MPRGIYKRKNGTMGQAKITGSKQLIMARARKNAEPTEVKWSTTDPNYRAEVEREIAEKELLTRRILVDRVDMIIQLLERLRGSL